MGHRASAVVGVVVLGLLAGCGAEASDGAAPRVNRTQVENLLVLRQKERNPGLRVDTAKCPDDVTARRGESFECVVQIEGQPVRFTVTVAEVVGTKARFDFRPVQAVVDVNGVANFVRSRLEEDWRMAQVDCGKSKMRLVDTGGVIECTVYNGTTTRYVQAVVEDRDGTVTLKER